RTSPINPPPMRSSAAGSGTGWNDATVVTPPSITDALPAVKSVALVLITRTFETCPGWSFADSGGPYMNPTTFPAALRSAVTGATEPSTKEPPGRLAPSVRKPVDVSNPLKLLSVSRESGSQGTPAPPQLGPVALFVTC